jgi:methionine-rich copper-binding protein CopC
MNTIPSAGPTARGAIRRSAAFGAVGILTVGLALGVAAPASAHNYLVSSTPAEGDVLTALPDEFVITTNDDLLSLGDGAGGFAMQVQDAAGLYYGDGCVTVAGPSMTAAASLGAPGAYVLTWQAVSIDGHTIDGQIPFSWTPDDITQSSEGRATAPVCGEVLEQPETDPTPTATADTEATAPPASAGDDSGIPGELLWIGGGVLAVVAAAAITMLVLSRRKKA